MPCKSASPFLAVSSEGYMCELAQRRLSSPEMNTIQEQPEQCGGETHHSETIKQGLTSRSLSNLATLHGSPPGLQTDLTHFLPDCSADHHGGGTGFGGSGCRRKMEKSCSTPPSRPTSFVIVCEDYSTGKVESLTRISSDYTESFDNEDNDFYDHAVDALDTDGDSDDEVFVGVHTLEVPKVTIQPRVSNFNRSVGCRCRRRASILHVSIVSLCPSIHLSTCNCMYFISSTQGRWYFPVTIHTVITVIHVLYSVATIPKAFTSIQVYMCLESVRYNIESVDYSHRHTLVIGLCELCRKLGLLPSNELLSCIILYRVDRKIGSIFYVFSRGLHDNVLIFGISRIF